MFLSFQTEIILQIEAIFYFLLEEWCEQLYRLLPEIHKTDTHTSQQLVKTAQTSNNLNLK